MYYKQKCSAIPSGIWTLVSKLKKYSIFLAGTYILLGFSIDFEDQSAPIVSLQSL